MARVTEVPSPPVQSHAAPTAVAVSDADQRARFHQLRPPPTLIDIARALRSRLPQRTRGVPNPAPPARRTPVMQQGANRQPNLGRAAKSEPPGKPPASPPPPPSGEKPVWWARVPGPQPRQWPPATQLPHPHDLEQAALLAAAARMSKGHLHRLQRWTRRFLQWTARHGFGQEESLSDEMAGLFLSGLDSVGQSSHQIKAASTALRRLLRAPFLPGMDDVSLGIRRRKGPVTTTRALPIAWESWPAVFGWIGHAAWVAVVTTSRWDPFARVTP